MRRGDQGGSVSEGYGQARRIGRYQATLTLKVKLSTNTKCDAVKAYSSHEGTWSHLTMSRKHLSQDKTDLYPLRTVLL